MEDSTNIVGRVVRSPVSIGQEKHLSIKLHSVPVQAFTPLPVLFAQNKLTQVIQSLGSLHDIVAEATETSEGLYNRTLDALRTHLGIIVPFVHEPSLEQRHVLSRFFLLAYAHVWHGRFLPIDAFLFMLEVYITPLVPERLEEIVEGKSRLRHFKDLPDYPYMEGYVHQQMGTELVREGVGMYAADAIYSAVGVIAKQWSNPVRFLTELAIWARRMQDVVPSALWQFMVRSYTFFVARQGIGLRDTHPTLNHVHHVCLLLSVQNLQPVGSVHDNTVTPSFSTFLLANTVVPAEILIILRASPESLGRMYLVGIIEVGAKATDSIADQIAYCIDHPSYCPWTNVGVLAKQMYEEYYQQAMSCLEEAGTWLRWAGGSLQGAFELIFFNELYRSHPGLSCFGAILGVVLAELIQSKCARLTKAAWGTAIGGVVILVDNLEAIMANGWLASFWRTLAQLGLTEAKSTPPVAYAATITLVIAGGTYYCGAYILAHIADFFFNRTGRMAQIGKLLCWLPGIEKRVLKIQNAHRKKTAKIISAYPMPTTPLTWASMTAHLLHTDTQNAHSNTTNFSAAMLALATRDNVPSLVYLESFSVFAVSYTRSLVAYLKSKWPLDETNWKTIDVIDGVVAYVSTLFAEGATVNTTRAVESHVRNNTVLECKRRSLEARTPLMETVTNIERFRLFIEQLKTVDYEIMEPLFHMVAGIFSTETPLDLSTEQVITWSAPVEFARANEIRPLIIRAEVAKNSPDLVRIALSKTTGWDKFNTLAMRLRTVTHKGYMQKTTRLAALSEEAFKRYTASVVLTTSVDLWESNDGGYRFSDDDKILYMTGRVPLLDPSEDTRFAQVLHVVVTATCRDEDLNPLANLKTFSSAFSRCTTLEIHRGAQLDTRWLSMFSAPNLTLHVNYVNNKSRGTIFTAVNRQPTMNVHALVIHEWWVDSFDINGFTSKSDLTLPTMPSVISLKIILHDWKLRENRTAWAQTTGLGHPSKWLGSWNLMASEVTKPDLRMQVPTKTLFQNLEEWHVTVADPKDIHLSDYASLAHTLQRGDQLDLPMDQFSDNLKSIMLPKLRHTVTVTEKNLSNGGSNLRRLVMAPDFNSVAVPANTTRPYGSLTGPGLPTTLKCTWYAPLGTNTGFEDEKFISRAQNGTIGDDYGNPRAVPRPIETQDPGPVPKRVKRRGGQAQVNALAVRFDIVL